MASNLRIHIAPVGFEVRRVTEPLICMRADKVYLVTYTDNDTVSKFFSEIKNELTSKYIHIEVKETYLDVWDLYSCIEEFRKIIFKEAGNNVYINVSTGTKITAIAGMLSCMMWNARPYYVSVSYPKKETKDIPTEHILNTSVFPTYEINKPKPTFMQILHLLQSHGNSMKKFALIDELEAMGKIRSKSDSGRELDAHAKHSQLRALLDPMEKDWNLITIKASGSRSEVSITEQGETALRVFGYNSGSGKF